MPENRNGVVDLSSAAIMGIFGLTEIFLSDMGESRNEENWEPAKKDFKRQ